MAAGANLEAKNKVRGVVGWLCSPACQPYSYTPGYLHWLRSLASVLQYKMTPLDWAQSNGQAEVFALLQAAAAAPASARR